MDELTLLRKIDETCRSGYSLNIFIRLFAKRPLESIC
jgi:hypothetical protein